MADLARKALHGPPSPSKIPVIKFHGDRQKGSDGDKKTPSESVLV
jgi:hypothetical protein